MRATVRVSTTSWVLHHTSGTVADPAGRLVGGEAAEGALARTLAGAWRSI